MYKVTPLVHLNITKEFNQIPACNSAPSGQAPDITTTSLPQIIRWKNQ
jgi:hypothetical protein